MRLAELVSEISRKTGLSQRQTRIFLQILTDEIRKGLKRDQKIQLRGWGTLYARKTSQGWRFVFKVSSQIKKKLNR